MVPITTDTILLPDNYPAHARIWRPVETHGAVLCFHGIQSHGGWYETSGSQLAAAGFAVVMPDRRGSGANPPPRGHFASLDECIADAHCLLNETRRLTRVDRVHLVGISWGGKQAVLLAQEQPRDVASLTLIGPGLFPRVDLTTAEKLGVALALVNDRTKLFDIPLNDAGFFTANPRQIRYVEQDALKLLQVSASFLLTSRRLDKHIRRFARSEWRGPVHLMLAGQDRIIDNHRTREWFEELPSHDKTLTQYSDAHHTLEFESNPEPFFRDLTEWLVRRR